MMAMIELNGRGQDFDCRFLERSATASYTAPLFSLARLPGRIAGFSRAGTVLAPGRVQYAEINIAGFGRSPRCRD